MKAVVYDAPRSFSYREVDDPKLAPHEALLRIEACGLCGTDLHIHEGEFGPRFPLIPGHEFTGRVVELGAEASGLQVGQRVVANNQLVCGVCFYCRRGDFLLCENMTSYGVHLDGGFAEYLKLRADCLFPIHRLLPREAIMVEPTACAIHGIEVLAAKPGSDTHTGGRGRGAAAPAGPKLDLAARLAAADVVAIDKADPTAHRRRLEALSPNGFDYVIEATGAPYLCEEALRFVRRRGTVLIYGVYPEAATARFNPFELFRKEVSIKGSFAQVDTFPRAIAYLESGRVNVKDVVTDELPLSDYGEALERAWKRQGIKMAIFPEG